MDLRIFKSEQDWVTASMVRILHACETPQGAKARVALSGGSTPAPVFRALATQSEFLENTDFYQVDERCVPAGDAHSNQKMIQNTLNPPRFFPFNTTLAPDESAREYDPKIHALAPHPFDLVLLGVGDDGHTASLFPDSDALTENKKWAVHTTTDQYDIHDRLTLTFPPILASKSILVLLRGVAKRPILEKLMSGTGDPQSFPALKLGEHTNLTVYFLEN